VIPNPMSSPAGRSRIVRTHFNSNPGASQCRLCFASQPGWRTESPGPDVGAARPLERAHIERLGLRPGWRCLEAGCGNGSIARWLASRVAPSGHVVASDLDITYVAGLQLPCLEVRKLDVLSDAIEDGTYDFVVARAMLHHIADPQLALRRMLAALKPGGVLLSIEPDMLPCTVAEPEPVRTFWQGWLQWSPVLASTTSSDARLPHGSMLSACRTLPAKATPRASTAARPGPGIGSIHFTSCARRCSSRIKSPRNPRAARHPLPRPALLDQRHHLHCNWGRKPA